MNVYIVIPCYNEAAFIKGTLESLLAQTVQAKQIVVVDDNSTDNSREIIHAFAKAYPEQISLVHKKSSVGHAPGSKVIAAFNEGLQTLDENYDIICKFDADLIFPSDYLEKIISAFTQNSKVGMVGGFCYIHKDGTWQLENLTNKDHIRGALKAYRKSCFTAIGGLKTAMGWDTVDELLAQYHGWSIITDPSLHVKHLKPTGATYNAAAIAKQGVAFYRLRYGLFLTAIASLKLALAKKKPMYFFKYLKAYLHAHRTKEPYLVTKKEGLFIRNLRWIGIKRKLLPFS